jgi:hypothetical protein
VCEPESSIYLQEVLRVFNQPVMQREVVAKAMTTFLLDFDPTMANELGLELLQWGFICGDIRRASYAITSYRGNLTFASPLVVGLASRCLWTVGDCLCVASHPDYLVYMTEMLKTLRGIAEIFAAQDTLGGDSTLLWISVECMKCNKIESPLVFEAACGLFEYIVGFPNMFSFLATCDNYASNKLTPGIFQKFHQPWDDVFHGVGHFLYEYDGCKPNMELVIRVLNLVLQTGYLPLFSDGEDAVYVALLSLLPWMWSILITDIARYIFDSPAVKTLGATHGVLCQLIADEEISKALSFLVSEEEIDVFSRTADLCGLIVPRIRTSELIILCKFFTNCLKFGDKYMKSPLYSVCGQIVVRALDQEPIIEALGSFTKLVERDKNEGRRSYVELYLELLPTRGHERRMNEIGHDKFPVMEMFERIVAVSIPHLYEVNLSEISSLSVVDLNSFPPLIPFDMALRRSGRLKILNDVMHSYRFEPFATWGEITAKLHTSMIDTEGLDVMRRRKPNFKVQAALSELVVKQQLRSQSMDCENDSTGMDQRGGSSGEKISPYGFIFIEAESFVPTVDEINLVGNDLFEDDLGLM